MNTQPLAPFAGNDETVALPTRETAKGLLGDCDLRWLAGIALLCAVLLRFVASH
ncbi:MAG: hypothetical protein HUU35_20125 [Armatimonadetes bacterium]|nr:hypothetical protein [Armatimonadota bacterium]